MLALCLTIPAMVATAPWIVPNWGGEEPTFPPGSLFWHTNEYRRAPTIYRTTVHVEEKAIAYGGFRIRASGPVYVFLNGRQIAATSEEQESLLDVELTPFLKPGTNVLAVSANAEGFSLDGGIRYYDGTNVRLQSEPVHWKVRRFPPLTILEDETWLTSERDEEKSFPVVSAEREGVSLEETALETLCRRLESERLAQWDEDARWRLRMLTKKGIALVDWEATGWGGPFRLPKWIVEHAQNLLTTETTKETLHGASEALCRYVRLRDASINLSNHAVGLAALNAPQNEIEACRNAASTLQLLLEEMKEQLQTGRYEQALATVNRGETIVVQTKNIRLLNEFCQTLDNKFSWFDSNLLVDNDPLRWGIRLGSPATLFASPLSLGALVALESNTLLLQGWDELPPGRVYNKPANTGPVSLWAALEGRVVALTPDENGVVYDRERDGTLTENWVLLVSDLSRGGPLPTQIVFLEPPTRILFHVADKGTRDVSVHFNTAGVRLFLLRPFKEWRGLLGQARTMTQVPLNENDVAPYVQQCRFWSRAVLAYPVTFSETFVRDGENALRVADVFNYEVFSDAWGTQPLRIAPLSPLASYGRMRRYPGLEVTEKAEVIGSLGIWGDFVARVDSEVITYRVPLDPIRRFGGFTSFCFGPTDIGEPGSQTEIETIRRTGANSFRPQHNQTGERAMRTLRWCLEKGLQHVFNVDEKWVLDAVEHYRTLARQCKDFPPDAVAYDLLNEPETRDPRAYNAFIRKITNAIREVDPTHLIYVETMPPWGPGAQPFPEGAFASLEPTGDPRTVYSFHDYEFRLPPRWPNDERDIRDILTRWIPAFRFSIDQRAPIHLGEFGGFEQTDQDVYTNPCALTLMMDFFRIFDAFGWHFHYYANRGTVRVRRDGSLQESYVQAAYRRYFARRTFNANRGSSQSR